jgi:ribosomal-protein-alanine N-acetyltransferase
VTGGVQVLDGKRVSLLWAGPERAADIARLHGALFDPPWDEASVRRTLDHPAATSFVATLGGPGEVIGFIIGQIAADEAEILSIGVDPARQRHGVGALLLGGLTRAVQRAEVQRLFLEVAADNAAALALYTRCGFAPTGRRKDYYARPGSTAVDAVTMARPLTM